MALLLRTLARTEIARSFHRDIVNENDFYYFYVGRTLEWDDEEAPETPVDSVSYDGACHRNMIFVKRIQSSDVVLMARRIDWVSGTIYDHYDDALGEYDANGNLIDSNTGATHIKDSDFYVMTDEYNVYKCLNNNNGAASVNKPTGTGTITSRPADGYIWKFLFRVEEADRIKFLTEDYIPVRKMSGTGVPLFDVNGKIDSITLGDSGSGYTSVPNVIINGDGTGATAHATISGGEITTLTLDTQGSGYTFAYVTFDGGGGSGATATVALGAIEYGVPQEDVEAAAVSGGIDRIEILNAGIDYASGDVLITITGDGTGAEATATVGADGALSGINVTNPGSGYTFADITISNISGVGSLGTARAIIAPIYGHGGNPPKELYATNLAISVNLDNQTSDYFLNNDYRQLGIIKNIQAWDSTDLFQTDTGTACYVVTVPDPTKYNNDDNITTNDGGEFTVIQVSGSVVYLLPKIPLITVSSTLTNNTTSVGSLVINSVTEPEVTNSTGEIIYVDNRTYIIRQEDQVEKVRAILRF